MPTTIGDGLASGGDLVVAAQRAVASALEPLGGTRPDLACVFVSGGDQDETAAALRHASDLLGARTTVGCTAHGVMAAGRAVESAGSVSVWAASLPGVTLRGFHLEVLRTSETIAVLGMPDRRDDDAVALVLADPWSFPADGFIGQSHDSLGQLPLVGGLASGAARAGETRLLLDGIVHDRGAVGVVLGGRVGVHTLVSQGCRPIGRAMTVTRAEGTTIFELAGLPALQRAQDAVGELPQEDQALAVRGLQLGIAIDEYADDHGSGDFLVRALAGADQAIGAIEVGDVVPVGTTVQFLLRDADAAHDDLAMLLGSFKERTAASALAGALVFSCNGRGRAMFPTADHDVRLVRELLGLAPPGARREQDGHNAGVAGFFAAGEFGPVGGRNHLHGFTATVLAFDR